MASKKLFNPFWQQTMLRIRDPKVSVPFYKNHFGLTLVDTYDFPEMKFSLYFLATLPQEEKEKVSKFAPGSEVWN
tara:strand:- start:1263 stop:1487 length:225 start_codon:yes stop_codon:yes gene_type:complete